MAIVRKGSIYFLSLSVATLVALSPWVLLMPMHNSDLKCLMLAILLGAALWFATVSGSEQRSKILRISLILAVISIGTCLIFRFLPNNGSLDLVTSNKIGPLFRLDGEAAYDAAVFEAWSELWIALGFSTLVISSAVILVKACKKIRFSGR
jgi:hypothetical protein